MLAQARISPSWAIRMLIAGAAFVGFGSWSFYDGKVKYPHQEKVFQEHKAAGQLEQFTALAGSKKWKVEIRTDRDGEEHVRSTWDIRTQFIMAGVCLPIGLILLGRLLRTFPKRLGADEEALYATSGQRIPYSAITGLDKRKWARKGIAFVLFTLDEKEGKAVIDDWIFKGGEAVLKLVEDNVDPAIAGRDDSVDQAPEDLPEAVDEEEDVDTPRAGS